ncbi:large subunit ribosomal protein L23 [Spirosomataceae bacterium TFI 002]|nr:large subunit ribosomal protein L23 [Spirosomataceae bacterium TFI 002]
MSVLLGPIITEKSQGLNAAGQYTFKVAVNSNKIEIVKAIEKMYGVTVDKVSTMRQIGKTKSRMTRGKISTGRTASYKKAIVKLAEGEIIDFYSEI